MDNMEEAPGSWDKDQGEEGRLPPADTVWGGAPLRKLRDEENSPEAEQHPVSRGPSRAEAWFAMGAQGKIKRQRGCLRIA